MLVRLRGNILVQLSSPLGIEQLHPRFGQIAGGFIEPGPQKLRDRVTRLVFERELFLPPTQQFAAMFFDQLVAGIRIGIQTKPFIIIGLFIPVPSIPLLRIVR